MALYHSHTQLSYNLGLLIKAAWTHRLIIMFYICASSVHDCHNLG